MQLLVATSTDVSPRSRFSLPDLADVKLLYTYTEHLCLILSVVLMHLKTNAVTTVAYSLCKHHFENEKH